MEERDRTLAGQPTGMLQGIMRPVLQQHGPFCTVSFASDRRRAADVQVVMSRKKLQVQIPGTISSLPVP